MHRRRRHLRWWRGAARVWRRLRYAGLVSRRVAMAAVVAAVRSLLGWSDGTVQHSPGGEPVVKVLPSREVRSYPRTAHVESRLGPGGVPFASNHVRTARYTALTFLPKQLWQQFSKVRSRHCCSKGGLPVASHI